MGHHKQSITVIIMKCPINHPAQLYTVNIDKAHLDFPLLGGQFSLCLPQQTVKLCLPPLLTLLQELQLGPLASHLLIQAFELRPLAVHLVTMATTVNTDSK